MLDHLYTTFLRARRAWYDRHPEARRRPRRPVVSVGNLRVGGSRKTPVVAAIASLLREMGERPAILSRGYARRCAYDGVVIVSDGVRIRADLDRAGDEPLMLARALPDVAVLVSPDRLLAARLAEIHLGATVHVLDDGFQHLAIARDVDVLLVSEDDLAERVLPRGRLREPIESARRADALVLIDGESSDAAALASRFGPTRERRSAGRDAGPTTGTDAGATKWFTLAKVNEAARLLEPMGQIVDPAGGTRSSRVVLVSGIARPARFMTDVARRGWDVAETMVFRDHHRFTREDVGRMAETVRRVGADLVLTTEKDLVRLLPLRPLPIPVAWLPLHVRLDPPAAFRDWLQARLSASRAQSPEPRA